MKDNINILGTNILNNTYEELTSLIECKIKIKEKSSFQYANVSVLLKYNKDKIFRQYLNSFSFLHSDGIGVYIASKILYGKKGLKERITGTDLYYHILKIADKNKLKCFFFGGSEEAVKILPSVLHKKFPGIQITGVIQRETEFRKNSIEKIKNSDSDILFVGLGTPYQERWISENFNSVDIPVQIAIGSGIEFISEAKKRAPLFLQSIGLEWIYRIYLEPKRLWKRYVFGIPLFMFKILILKVKLLFKIGQ